MYLFMSNTEVIPYNGEILKRYVGKRLVKTIANPADEDLKEFGYMELIEGVVPEYNLDTQYLTETYTVVDYVIMKTYEIAEIPIIEEIIN